MAVGKELLIDTLPDDVKPKVVWRPNYWLTGEALSTYVRSAGLFGNEMHSPIMCIGNGIPAIVCRWAEQTSKGLMWRDIGLGDWLFDLDKDDELARVADAVLAMYHDQGLPVLKHAGFGHAVNITLGLPVLRTSVDHGTALSLAGTGRADPGSLRAAVDLAASLAAQRIAGRTNAPHGFRG
jgi:hypothetical protein